HPNVLEGNGLEDGKTLERVFSASNALAPVTRYASKYRRRMFIDEYFRQWDEEKYANMSLMIYNNYTQALEILNRDALSLMEAMESANVTLEEVTQWGIDETAYFKTLGQEKPWDVFAVAYVEKLQEYRAARAGSGTLTDELLGLLSTEHNFLPPETGPVDYRCDISHTQKLEAIEAKWLYTEERQRARWQPSDEEYIKTVKYIDERRYHRALDKLQQLVIQRLFELHKMNLSQTGYRMHTHMAKSLQTRCKAIQSAVKAYNAAA
ncbi:hypothetical protein DAEQUDRAFT_653957, partial [Daedalea quercina L-15889]